MQVQRKKLTVRVTEDAHARIVVAAERNGCDVNSYMVACALDRGDEHAEFDAIKTLLNEQRERMIADLAALAATMDERAREARRLLQQDGIKLADFVREEVAKARGGASR